jgi:Glycosyl transferase family 2
MLPKVAAITMVYNEPVFLPFWTRHYARQVGADHCYVVNHGSDMPLTVPPGVNVLRLPRSPHDDPKRAQFIASFTASLLQYYDWVIHTDVDEIVLADPHDHRDLTGYCATTALETVTAIGLDVQHVPELETPLDPGRRLGEQRGWVRFTSAMCKPVLTRRALDWAPGFHCADAPLVFDRLYLFHLHWADRAAGLARLTKTRTMPWASEAFGAHQRITDAQWAALFDGMASLPRCEPATFAPNLPPIAGWLDRTRHSMEGREGQTYTLDLAVNAAELWAIPRRFRDRL